MLISLTFFLIGNGDTYPSISALQETNQMQV